MNHRKCKRVPEKTSISALLTMPKPFDCVDHNKLWKILKEMGIPEHLTCLLRNLYAGQEAAVRTGHGTTDWFQIGKGVHKVLLYVHKVHKVQFSSVTQSCPTLRPHESQHARSPCPSPTPDG